MAEYTGEVIYEKASQAKAKPVVNPALAAALVPQSAPVSMPIAPVSATPSIALSPQDQRSFALSEANRRAAANAEAAKIKSIPEPINSAVLQNHQSLNKLDDALDLLEANKDAIGLKGNLGQTVLNKLDPKGIDTRAAIADIGSIVLHDRSGAAVTAAESPRLLPFIPTPSDTYEAAKSKLTRMRKYAAEEQDALKATYGKEQGYKDFPNLPARAGVNKPPVGAPPEAKKAPDGKWYSPDPARPGKYVQWGD
jgi:hypothetical protein